MKLTPSVAEVARNFADYVNRVAVRGESFVLMRGTRAVAELRPVVTGRKLRDLPEILASLPHLTEAEAASFGEDVERARSELSALPLIDPWES
ncbi:MAG: Antitoxin [Gemmatimonadetes bacterium]|nr:Antitoxin [Gemmatimonadota bacterium]